MQLKLGQYRKSIASVIGLVLTYATLNYGTNHWVVLAVMIAAGLGVYHLPNDPKPPSPPTGM